MFEKYPNPCSRVRRSQSHQAMPSACRRFQGRSACARAWPAPRPPPGRGDVPGDHCTGRHHGAGPDADPAMILAPPRSAVCRCGIALAPPLEFLVIGGREPVTPPAVGTMMLVTRCGVIAGVDDDETHGAKLASIGMDDRAVRPGKIAVIPEVGFHHRPIGADARVAADDGPGDAGRRMI